MVQRKYCREETIKKVVLNIEYSFLNYFNNTYSFVSDCLQAIFSEDNSIIIIIIIIIIISDEDGAQFRRKSRRVGSSVPGERCSKVYGEVSYSVEVERPRADLFISRERDVIPARMLNVELRVGLRRNLQKEVHSQKWQGKFLSAREEDEDLNFEGCFWWLTGWQNCPTHTVVGLFELYEQLLPTRLYASQKMGKDSTGVATCRLCYKAPESVPNVLASFITLPQNKYLTRHNVAFKTLFFKIVHDVGFIESLPPWYSPVKPKPVYEAEGAQAFWDIPVFAVHEEVTANRVDARFIDHQT